MFQILCMLPVILDTTLLSVISILEMKASAQSPIASRSQRQNANRDFPADACILVLKGTLNSIDFNQIEAVV